MTDLLDLGVALLAAMVGSELVLGGTKLQTGLSRVIPVWGAVYLVALFVLWRGGIGPVGLTIFWGGAFATWFGVRSHLESSILLRMLYLLRGQPRTDQSLLDEYLSRQGEAERLEELVRGGLVTSQGERIAVTPKGRSILAVVARLR